jgi:hypothetical protein
MFGADFPQPTNFHEMHKLAGIFTLTMKGVEGETDTIIIYALRNYQRLLRFFLSSSKQNARQATATFSYSPSDSSLSITLTRYIALKFIQSRKINEVDTAS